MLEFLLGVIRIINWVGAGRALKGFAKSWLAWTMGMVMGIMLVWSVLSIGIICDIVYLL